VIVKIVAVVASASTSDGGAAVKPVAAAKSANTSNKGASVEPATVARSASISECGAGVKPVERSRARPQKLERDRQESRKFEGRETWRWLQPTTSFKCEGIVTKRWGLGNAQVSGKSVQRATIKGRRTKTAPSRTRES